MASVSVKVNPIILNWLMQKAKQGNIGNSVIDLIQKWISGEKEPTLPVGTQFAAAHGREDTLLSLAAQLEQIQPWAEIPQAA